MANYYGTGRTNYFAVKDAEAFKADMENYSVYVAEGTEKGQQVFALIGESEEGMPVSYWNEDTEDHDDIDWAEVIGKHLADDWVCVIQEVGNEKARYVNGYSMAFNNKGGVKTISIDDIWKLTDELGARCVVA